MKTAGSAFIYKMLDCTVLQSAVALEERISLVQKKRLDKRYCCKHLFDDFDPKHCSKIMNGTRRLPRI